MAFDPTKPVRTRDGRTARIICTDAKGDQPIIALIVYDGGEFMERCNANGAYNYEREERESCLDLVNIPERRSYWMNVYSDGQTGTSYHSIHSLDELPTAAKRNVVARLELVYEDDKLVEVIKHDVSND